MTDRVEKPELVRRVAERLGRDAETVGEVVDAVLAEIYEALKRGQPVALRDFGSPATSDRSGTAGSSILNPSQRLRRLFCWSSTYRGEV